MTYDSGSPKRCSNRFSRFKHKIGSSVLNIGFQTKNSSDLERAPGARSIGAEFIVWNPLVKALLRCENVWGFHTNAATFWV